MAPRLLSSQGVLALALLLAAQPGGPRLPDHLLAPPPPEPSHRWYGWQNLLIEGVGVGLAALAVETRSSALLVSAGAIGVFGSPAVHWAHGRVGAGFASLGMQVGLPTLGGALGGAAMGMDAAHGEEIWSALAGAAYGALAAKALAVVLDAGLVAWEEAPAVSPSLVVGPAGASVGLRLSL